MKLIRSTFIALMTALIVPAQPAFAYLDIVYSSGVEFDYVAKGELSDVENAYGSVNPNFGIRFKAPDLSLDAPLTTISLSDPSIIMDPFLFENTQIVPGPIGSITVTPEARVAAWDFSFAMVAAPQVGVPDIYHQIAILTSTGGPGTCNCNHLEFRMDNFRWYDFFDPFPIEVHFSGVSEYYDGHGTGWFVSHVDVPEPGMLLLWASGMGLVIYRRRNSPHSRAQKKSIVSCSVPHLVLYRT